MCRDDQPSALASVSLSAGGLALLPLALLVAAKAVNPWFIDSLALAAGLLGLPAVLGAALGWRVQWAPQRWLKPSLALWLIALLGLLSLLRPAPRHSPLRLLVVGVDGADWHTVEGIEGLRTLPRLRRDGASGDLRSHQPLFSPLLWTSIASGQPPEVHGIHGFNTRSDAVAVPRFWDVAQAHGLRVGIYKWLVSWPPQRLDGFMVPAWLARDPTTFPAELGVAKRIEQGRGSAVGNALDGVRHGLRLSTLASALWWTARDHSWRAPPAQRFVALQRLRLRIDRDLFVHAVHRYRPALASFTIYATDAVAHRSWAQHDGVSDPLSATYRDADAVLGELIASLGPQGTVIVVSDHGSQAMAAHRAAPTTEALRRRLSPLGPLQLARIGTKLVVTPEAGGPSHQALVRALSEVTIDQTGAPFYRLEAIPGSPSSVGLNLHTDRPDAAWTVGGEVLSDWVRPADPDFSGDHAPLGLFAAVGPGVAAGSRVDLDLLDVAPTILAALALPSLSLPGRAQIWSAQPTAPLHSQQRWVPVHDQGEPVDALRALGYMAP